MKKSNEVTAFSEWQNVEEIILYGAGIVGQNTYQMLVHPFSGIVISDWCVTDGNENDYKTKMTESMFGVKIKPLSEVNASRNTPVLISTSPSYHDQIAETLHKYGFSRVFFLTEEVRLNIFTKIYSRLFSDLGVDYSDEIITMPVAGRNTLFPLKLPNPFVAEQRERNALFSEYGTIVLPFCLGNTDLSSETPYEYGDVLLPPGEGVVLDCGANMGLFSCCAAALGNLVYAFEPSPGLHKPLLKLSCHYDEKIIVMPYAIADYDGTAMLNIDEFSDSANSLVLKTNVETQLEVQSITIDSAVKHFVKSKSVDFIKADIEGAERQMLKGANSVLSEYAPKLSICTYHLEDDPIVLSKLIRDADSNYSIIQTEKKIYAYI